MKDCWKKIVFILLFLFEIIFFYHSLHTFEICPKAISERLHIQSCLKFTRQTFENELKYFQQSEPILLLTQIGNIYKKYWNKIKFGENCRAN